MSIHKLTAGSGYDYLTRQVAALDATEKGHTGLASYYTERGETPGVWIGSGLDGIDGLTADNPVTAEQMRALFGCGLHPLAELRQQQLEGPDLSPGDYQDAARLGAPFRVVDGDGAAGGSERLRRRTAVILISTHAEEDYADLIAASPAAGFLPKISLSAGANRDLLGIPT
jgi:hypothetical protein